MKEEWQDVKGFEGVYQISNLGRVKSLPRNGSRCNGVTIRKTSLTKDGYEKIRLLHHNKDVTTCIHRLVAMAFIPNIENKPTINHKDGNKLNNCVSNLEWSDRHEQLVHAYKMGLKKPVHTNRKLTDEQVEEIKRLYVRQSKEFGTVALAKKYGVTNCVIGNIVRGKTYV